MPFGWASAAVGAYSAYNANKNSKAAAANQGGGGASAAYQPAQLATADWNLNQNKQNYQDLIYGMDANTQGLNKQNLDAAYNNPYMNIAQSNANQAGLDYEQLGWKGMEQSGKAWDYADQQYANAAQAKQRFDQNFGNVKNASDTMYGMAGQSNKNYDDLMNYQKGQLGDIQNSQSNLYGSGNKVLDTAFDPQQALYNRTQQQLTDQQRAAQYARGVQASPYGAALENSANENFNIDWQNQQLARQSQGLAAAQGAYGSAQNMGNSYTGTQAGLNAGKNEQYAGLTNAATSQYANYLAAINQSNTQNSQNIAGAQQNAYQLQSQAAQAAYQAGQAPYSAYNQILGNQNQALQNYWGNSQPFLSGLNQIQSNDLGYMNQGTSAANVGFQQNKYNTDQNQQAISSIAGPVVNSLKNTDWGSLGNTVSGWFGGGSNNNGNDPALMNWANNSGSYGSSGNTGW